MQAQAVAHHGAAPDQGEAPRHDAARGVALAAQGGALNEDSIEEKKFVYHVSLRKWNLSSRDLLMVSIKFLPRDKVFISHISALSFIWSVSSRSKSFLHNTFKTLYNILLRTRVSVIQLPRSWTEINIGQSVAAST